MLSMFALFVKLHPEIWRILNHVSKNRGLCRIINVSIDWSGNSNEKKKKKKPTENEKFQHN